MYCLNIFVFYKCFAKHILIILFSSWNLPHISSLLNEFHMFSPLSLLELPSTNTQCRDKEKWQSEIKTNNRKTNKTKKKYQSQRKSVQSTWSPFCDGQLLLGMRPALDIPSDYLLQKTDFSLCQQVSVTALFSRKFQITSVRGGTWCLPPLLVARILSGLSLCRTCICYWGLCEFVCVSVLLSLEYTVWLESCTISRSHNLPISSSTEIHESWEYGFDEDIVFRVMNFNVSYSLHKFSNLPKHDQYHSGTKCTNTRVFWRDFTFRPKDRKTEALRPLLVTPWNWR